MRGRDCLVVMAREPVPGSTKTRLAAAIGDREAASVYEAFLLDTLAICSNVPADLLISYAPDGRTGRSYFRDVAATAMLVAQEEASSFGARLTAAMQAAFERGFARVAVIGSDVPHMATAWIEDAFASLDDCDVALGPTRDGGYYLLALRRPEERLFADIDWSSGREFGQTLQRARDLELRVSTVCPTFDIDDATDLRALRREIETSGDALCPRTAAALRRLDAATRSFAGTPVR
ncbi:MAG: TIGR04282 family arsenosugar biosynthesis glycosyltransferase [Chloroflexi bacterium]|nr:TIGR04282 family arsenosugar biosynthesis glycosyltransferase [Chloroflexota bacterium]